MGIYTLLYYPQCVGKGLFVPLEANEGDVLWVYKRHGVTEDMITQLEGTGKIRSGCCRQGMKMLSG